MTDLEKIEKIVSAIGAETSDDIVPNALLADIPEWDSMGMINFIGLVKELFGKVLRHEDLERLIYVSDLMNIMRH